MKRSSGNEFHVFDQSRFMKASLVAFRNITHLLSSQVPSLNESFSLQMLAECKKQSSSFIRLLSIHEEKPGCANRSLETFLTLPMHRVPGYIITLHRLLAFTPPDHVDRECLEYSQGILEELSMVRMKKFRLI